MLQQLSNGYRTAKNVGNRFESLILNLTGRGYIPDPIADDIEREQRGEKKTGANFQKFQTELFGRLERIHTLIAMALGSSKGAEVAGLSMGAAVEKNLKSSASSFNFGALGALALLKMAKAAIAGAIAGFIKGLQKVFGQIKKLITSAIRLMSGIRKAFSNLFKLIGKVIPKIKAPGFLKALAKSLQSVKKIPVKIAGGVLAKLGPGVSKFFSVLKTIGKRAPIVGAMIIPVIEAIESNAEIKELIRQKENGEITESEFRQKTAESMAGAVIDSVAITAGASIGAAVVGAGLGAVTFGFGALLGAVLGGAAGGAAGALVSDFILKPLLAPALGSAALAQYDQAEKIANNLALGIEATMKSLDPGYLIDNVIAPSNPEIATQLHNAMDAAGSAARVLNPFAAPEQKSASKITQGISQSPPPTRPNPTAPKVAMKDPVGHGQSTVILNNQTTVVNSTRIFAR